MRRLLTGGAQTHAVLLYGLPGGGQTAVADLLVEGWLGPEGAPSWGRRRNPDVLEIRPGGPSELIRLPRITATDELKPEDPTPLRDFFRTAPLRSDHKVAYLHAAHRMNAEAANALLKTLEEPLPYARLVLTTTEVGTMLATVRSRCLNLACELPSPAEARLSRPEATDDEWRLAGGSPYEWDRLRPRAEAVAKLREVARTLVYGMPPQALRLAEMFHEAAGMLEKVGEQGARHADAEALALLARLLREEPDASPQAVAWTVDAHARVLGNASAALVVDALFTRILVRRREPAAR